ncbi:Smr/MutS family protein [Candidatus Uhrbacteria bacterium]|nr:Smr/MutS family protein [Candidatus Uhrbacteria bacterium]
MPRRIVEMPSSNEPSENTDPYEPAFFAAELGEAPEINLHGMSVDEALSEVDRFLHQELMRGSEVIRIIHGHGEQKLRAAIDKWLARQKELDLVAAYRGAQHRSGQQNAVTYAALHRIK